MTSTGQVFLGEVELTGEVADWLERHRRRLERHHVVEAAGGEAVAKGAKAHAFRLQKDDMLIREHVDAHRLDRTRHEHRHKPTRSNRRASLIAGVRALAETESTLLASLPQ